jgi:phosphoglycerate-specific signal transduction histidine kinase
MNTLEVEELDLTEITDIVNRSINTTENQTETGEIKESIVLDLTTQLKEKFDKIHNLELKLINRKKRETKQLLKVYGLIKSIEKMISETIEVPVELGTLIDITADLMEDFINEEFFPSLYRYND